MTTSPYLTDLSFFNDKHNFDTVKTPIMFHPSIRRIEIPSAQYREMLNRINENSVDLSLVDPNIAQLQELNSIPSFSAQISVSETFSAKNFGSNVGDRLEVIENLCKLAQTVDVSPTVYLHTAFCCPFEGSVIPQTATMLAAKLLRAGCAHFCLVDNCGCATLEETLGIINVISSQIPKSRIGFLLSYSNPKLSRTIEAIRNSGIHYFCCAQMADSRIPFSERDLFIPAPETFITETQS